MATQQQHSTTMAQGSKGRVEVWQEREGVERALNLFCDEWVGVRQGSKGIRVRQGRLGWVTVSLTSAWRDLAISLSVLWRRMKWRDVSSVN